MWFLLIVIAITSITSSSCIESNPHKNSHLMELRKLLGKYVYKNTDSIDGNNIRRFLFGRNRKEKDKIANFKELHSKHLLEFIEDERKRQFPDDKTMSGRKLAHDYLSLTGKIFKSGKHNLTKQAMLKKLYAKSKGKMARAYGNDSRRYTYYLHRDHEDSSIAYEFDIHTVEIIRNLMLQTVYQARYDLQRTLIYRKKFANDASYDVAQLHAVLQENLNKIRTLHTTCMNMLKYPKIVFLPYLITYEKSLQAHTDVHFYVRRLFQIHANFLTELEQDRSKEKEMDDAANGTLMSGRVNASSGGGIPARPGKNSTVGNKK